MADSIDPSNNGLTSNQILPTLPEIQSASDPTALLKTPTPIITPVIPNGLPQNLNINEQLQGDYNTGPNPGAKPSNIAKGTTDYANAIIDKIQNDDLVKDEFKYGRTYSYGSGYKNQNFERYYKHDKFKQLGFSPYRDNEAVYNQQGSWWDDFNRMTGEWGNLAYSGFKSIWGSEETANEEMEKGMAIGSSSRGGFGGSVVNFGLNSAYTVGIIGELALEDLALGAIEGFSGGLASGAVLPTAAARNTMAFGKLIKVWEGTAGFLKALKNAETAKDVFNAAKAGEKLTDFAKFMNPLQRSVEWTTHLAKGTNGVKNLGSMAKVTKTFGNFYRDLRELNVAHSEAKLEGEGAANEYQNKLIDEFYNNNGRMPNDTEAQEIYQRAQSVKATVTLANDLTIYATNKLVFDDLFEGFRPGAKISEAFLEGTGRFLKRTEAAAFKAGETTAFQAAEKSTGKKVADFLLKSEYVPWSRKYIVGNLGEALQENAQEIIRISAQDYYDKVHSDPSQLGFYGTMASIGKGTSDQFSGQGLETFLSGFMMGSLIQAGGKGLKSLGDVGSRGAKAAAYSVTGGKRGQEWGAETEAERAKKQAEQTDNDVLNAANYIAENALIYGGHRADIASSIKLAAEAKRAKVAEGDQKTARDMTNELQLNQFDILAKTGNMGLITEHVNDMVKLSNEDLQNAYNNPVTSEGVAMTGEQIREKLQGLKNNAEGYQRAYEKAHKLRPNPFNPWMFNPKKNPEAYDEQMNGYLAHEAAISDMIFANETYTNIAERMSKMGAEMAGTGVFSNLFNTAGPNNPIGGSIGTDISLLVDNPLMVTHLQSLKDQIDTYSTGTADEKRKAKELEKTRDLLTEWRMHVDRFRSELKSDKGENLDWHIQQMHDVYSKYVNHVAKTKNGFVFTEQMNKGFNQLKDFLALEHDKGRYVNTINRFSDPNMFDRYINIQKEIQASQRAQKIENLNKALENFKQMAKTNKMINEIFDLGLFAMPDDVERLKNFTIVDFYNVADKSLLSKSDPKYKQALDIIEKYAEQEGKTATGKDIEEAGTDVGAAERARYNANARRKAKNDKRGYKDLAKQFGFDPSVVKSTVGIEQVLTAIVDSDFATPREKTLARRLLTVVKPGQIITFSANLPNPGYYSSATKETVVDARYSSEDYTIGKDGHPIEHVILHEVLHSLTVEGLDTDAEFKDAITKMLDAAKAYQQTAEFKNTYGNKPLYGTMNEAEFVAEALTNDTFQSMLRRIPYEVSGKPSSAWDAFLDAVAKMFTKLLGVLPTSSVLDEAMFIITSKIDGKPVQRAAAEKATVKLKTGDQVSQTTPIGDIKQVYNQLYLDLVKAFRENANYPEAERKLPEDQLVKSEAFNKFRIEGSGAQIVANFNIALEQDTKRQPGTKPVQKTKVKELISDDDWNDFINNGSVSEENLNAIADKLKFSGTGAMSERELAIYTSKAKEIKDISKAAREKEIAEEANLPKEIQLRNKITELETEVSGLNNFIINTDDTVAAFKAQKQLKTINKEIQNLKDELAALESLNRQATSEEQELTFDKVMEALSNVTSKQEIEDWKKSMAVPFIQSITPEEQARLKEEYGKDPEDVFRDIEEDKKKALAANLDIDTLDIGTIVLLNDQNKKRVVAENTGESVTLVSTDKFRESFEKDPETGVWTKKEGVELEDDQKTLSVSKAELKDKIFIKNSEFKEIMAKVEEPTPEQVQESNEAVENPIETDAATQAAEEVESQSNQQIKEESKNAFKNCKVS